MPTPRTKQAHIPIRRRTAVKGLRFHAGRYKTVRRTVLFTRRSNPTAYKLKSPETYHLLDVGGFGGSGSGGIREEHSDDIAMRGCLHLNERQPQRGLHAERARGDNRAESQKQRKKKPRQ